MRLESSADFASACAEKSRKTETNFVKKLCVNLKNRPRLLKQYIEHYTQHYQRLKREAKKKEFERSQQAASLRQSVFIRFQNAWDVCRPKILRLYSRGIVNCLIARKYEWISPECLLMWRLAHKWSLYRFETRSHGGMTSSADNWSVVGLRRMSKLFKCEMTSIAKEVAKHVNIFSTARGWGATHLTQFRKFT